MTYRVTYMPRVVSAIDEQVKYLLDQYVPPPSHPGLYRTDWVTDTALLPGETGDHAPSSGLLHTITTGDAGDLFLELSMYYRDDESGVWTNMEAAKSYEVQP